MQENLSEYQKVLELLISDEVMKFSLLALVLSTTRGRCGSVQLQCEVNAAVLHFKIITNNKTK